MTNGIDASTKMDLLLADAFMTVKETKVAKLNVSTNSRHDKRSVLVRYCFTPFQNFD